MSQPQGKSAKPESSGSPVAPREARAALPTIESRSSRWTSVQLHDFPSNRLHAIVSWRKDHEVNQFLRPGMRTQEQVQTWYDETFSPASNRLFAIYHDHDLIGYSSIEDIDSITQNCEFGIVIGHTQYWRQGIGKTVIKKMLEMAFTQFAFSRHILIDKLVVTPSLFRQRVAP